MSQGTQYSAKEKIRAVLNWAVNSEVEFNTTFVESLDAQVKDGKFLSSKQEWALNNIISKFNIDVSKWKVNG